MNNVPDPVLSGKELPDFKFALEKSEARVMGKSFAREAAVKEFPISKGIAGVSMGMQPGVMRELHWHATAAEWAFVDKGRVRTSYPRPRRLPGDQRLRARRRLVLPARPRAFDPVPGQRAVPLHPDLRQRLLLRVRHVQHQRLGVATLPRNCWRRTSASPPRRSTTSLKKEVYYAKGALPPIPAAAPLGGPDVGPRTHKYRFPRQR